MCLFLSCAFLCFFFLLIRWTHTDAVDACVVTTDPPYSAPTVAPVADGAVLVRQYVDECCQTLLESDMVHTVVVRNLSQPRVEMPAWEEPQAAWPEIMLTSTTAAVRKSGTSWIAATYGFCQALSSPAVSVSVPSASVLALRANLTRCDSECDMLVLETDAVGAAQRAFLAIDDYPSDKPSFLSVYRPHFGNCTLEFFSRGNGGEVVVLDAPDVACFNVATELPPISVLRGARPPQQTPQQTPPRPPPTPPTFPPPSAPTTVPKNPPPSTPAAAGGGGVYVAVNEENDRFNAACSENDGAPCALVAPNGRVFGEPDTQCYVDKKAVGYCQQFIMSIQECITRTRTCQFKSESPHAKEWVCGDAGKPGSLAAGRRCVNIFGFWGTCQENPFVGEHDGIYAIDARCMVDDVPCETPGALCYCAGVPEFCTADLKCGGCATDDALRLRGPKDFPPLPTIGAATQSASSAALTSATLVDEALKSTSASSEESVGEVESEAESVSPSIESSDSALLFEINSSGSLATQTTIAMMVSLWFRERLFF